MTLARATIILGAALAAAGGARAAGPATPVEPSLLQPAPYWATDPLRGPPPTQLLPAPLVPPGATPPSLGDPSYLMPKGPDAWSLPAPGVAPPRVSRGPADGATPATRGGGATPTASPGAGPAKVRVEASGNVVELTCAAGIPVGDCASAAGGLVERLRDGQRR